jgi:hypothetical protein
MTRDIDVAVAVGDDRQAEKVVAALVARGYRVRALVEQESAGRLANVFDAWSTSCSRRLASSKSLWPPRTGPKSFRASWSLWRRSVS